MNTTSSDEVEKWLTPVCARMLRRDLKAALTVYANGQGRIEGLLHEIERVAKYVTGNPDVSLGGAERRMHRFVKRHASARLEDTGLPGVGWRDLYRGVQDARNDIAHTGTEAALAGVRTATMATVMMEALGKVAMKNKTRSMKDVMVSNPVCAQGWQTLADVRRTMLVNDYSVLPLSNGGCGVKWSSVRAEDLTRYLTDGSGCGRRETLGDAIKSRSASCLVHPLRAFREKTPVEVIWSDSSSELPVVVTRSLGAGSEKSEIVGIITAFDLL